MPKTKENKYHTVDELGDGRGSYRIVNKLKGADLIKPKRGNYNRILLNDQDLAVCKEFAKFSENHETLSIALAEYKSEHYKKEVDKLKEELKQRDREIEGLHNALQLKRQPWYLRPFSWLKQLVRKLPG